MEDNVGEIKVLPQDEYVEEPPEFSYPLHKVNPGEVWGIGTDRVVCGEPKQAIAHLDRVLPQGIVTGFVVYTSMGAVACYPDPALIATMIQQLEYEKRSRGAVIDRLHSPEETV